MGLCAFGRANELVGKGDCMVTSIILYLCPLYQILIRRKYCPPPPPSIRLACVSVAAAVGWVPAEAAAAVVMLG